MHGLVPDPDLLAGGLHPSQIITDVAHPARMYNYLLGGRDNYQADREATDAILADFPQLREIARANRAFQERAIRTIVAEHGIRQIIDIGAGIPSAPNTHQTAQEIAPESRVVYIDNDPIVFAHDHARLRESSPRTTAVIEADLRSYKEILSHPALHEMLDLSRPVGLLLVSVLHFLPDTDQPHEIVRGLMAALAPGSALVLSHATEEGESDKAIQAAAAYQHTQAPITLRDRTKITAFFDGLVPLEPGVVKQPWWRPPGQVADDPSLNWGYGGVGITPAPEHAPFATGAR